MRTTPFSKAVEEMLKNLPAYQTIIDESVQLLRRKRCTSFESLRRTIPTLRQDLLIVAIRLLPYLDSRRAGDTLLTVLRDDHDSLIRLETAKTLATLSPKNTTRSLLACLRREQNADVRYWLVYVVGCLAQPTACEPLLEVLRDVGEDIGVRSQAAEGLAYILEWRVDKRTLLYRRSVKALTDMLDDPQAEIRFWAAFALGSAQVRSALGKLRQLAKTDKTMCPGWWPVCLEAADAIQVINGGEWPERIQAR